MKATLLAFTLSFVLCACASSDKPAEAIDHFVTALNNQDSAALVNSFSEGVRAKLATGPESVHWLLDTAKGTTLTSTIYSVNVDGDIANILYAIKAKGKINLLIDSISGQAYKEADGWKYGFLFTKQQFIKFKPLS
jgi:hypothetical protein